MASPPQHLTMGTNDVNIIAVAANDGVFLPRDILGDILLRVPARPLCRLRAVCRSWRSLLTDHLFVAAHGARHPGPLFAISTSAVIQGEEVEVRFVDTYGGVVKRHVTDGRSCLAKVQPHLGLVLIRLVATPPLRVLDPATGAVSSHRDKADPYNHGLVLGWAASARVGGGTSEYKVFRFGSHPPAGPRFCRILTLGAGGGGGSWRDAPALPFPVVTLSYGVAVANGVVYCICRVPHEQHDWTIAAFDLAAEQWRPSFHHGPAPLPSAGRGTAKKSLAGVNGCLAAVALSVSTMDMWFLAGSGDGAAWRKRCTVATSVIQGRLEDTSIYLVEVEPLWVLDDGRVALWVTTNSTVYSHFIFMHVLRMYDPRTGTCTDVADFGRCIEDGVGVYTGNLLHLQPAAVDQ